MKEKDSDIALFYQIKNGNEKVMEIIFHQYFTKLCLYVFSIVNDEYISEDIVIELLTNIWLKRENIEITISLKAYLYTSARNNSLVYLKKKKLITERFQSKENLIECVSSSITDELDNKIMNTKVSSVLNKIPPRSRQVFILHRFEEMKYKEIAVFLNISIKTVEVHIGKAIRILNENKKLLEQILKTIIIFYISKILQ